MAGTDAALAQRSRRLFFALWPDPATRRALAQATRKAVRHSGGRPVAEENLHATVAFLGAVAADRLDAVLAAGAAAAQAASAFTVAVTDLEIWPRPQVLVATAATPPEAVALAEDLWRRLAPLGIAPDPRPLRLHVTLARKVGKPGLGHGMRPVAWSVRDLALVESVTEPDGARYVPLAAWPLPASGGGVTP